MNNPTSLFAFYILIISFFSLGCNVHIDKNEAVELVELTGDGSWGYAGRFAHIASNKLFYSYLDNEGCTWVASYCFETGEIIRNNIWKGQPDLHSANPILIRPDGRIQVFLDRGGYSKNNIAWKVSSMPFSVNEFGELKESSLQGDIVQGRQFYPMAHEGTGEVYLVINALRDDFVRETVMWRSPDGGDTWIEYNNLWGLGKGLDGNRCYTRTYLKGDDIHFVTLKAGWGESLAGNNIGMVEGIYYTRYNVTEQSFYFADGKRSFGIEDTPLYETKYFDEIWNWSRDGDKIQRALWSDIVADKQGKPYVAFAVMESVPQGESILHDGYWSTTNKEGVWHFHKVAKLARGWDNKPERKNYSIAIDTEDPETVYVSVNISDEGDLSQIRRMKTRDKGKTWQTSAILSDEGRLTTVVVPVVKDQSDRKVDVLWLDGRMKGWSDFNTKIMMFGKKTD